MYILLTLILLFASWSYLTSGSTSISREIKQRKLTLLTERLKVDVNDYLEDGTSKDEAIFDLNNTLQIIEEN